MRVYHFLNKYFGLKDLKEKRLKIARIMELNDPFEFLGANLSDKDFRKAMKATKKNLSRTKGLLCFSKNWNNPVQWGHYANKHKGLCLGFDVPDHKLSKVDYVEERLVHKGKIDESLMLKCLTTKFSHWHYEEEYRFLLSLDNDIGGFYYADFSDDLILKQVIVGAHSSISRTQIKEALGNLNSGIEIFKARAAFKSFDVVKNNNALLWT